MQDIDDPCSKYAYAIALTGFSGDIIMDDDGCAIEITEHKLTHAVNQIHDAWDAHREMKKSA